MRWHLVRMPRGFVRCREGKGVMIPPRAPLTGTETFAAPAKEAPFAAFKAAACGASISHAKRRLVALVQTSTLLGKVAFVKGGRGLAAWRRRFIYISGIILCLVQSTVRACVCRTVLGESRTFKQERRDGRRG